MYKFLKIIVYIHVVCQQIQTSPGNTATNYTSLCIHSYGILCIVIGWKKRNKKSEEWMGYTSSSEKWSISVRIVDSLAILYLVCSFTIDELFFHLLLLCYQLEIHKNLSANFFPRTLHIIQFNFNCSIIRTIGIKISIWSIMRLILIMMKYFCWNSPSRNFVPTLDLHIARFFGN